MLDYEPLHEVQQRRMWEAQLEIAKHAEKKRIDLDAATYRQERSEDLKRARELIRDTETVEIIQDQTDVLKYMIKDSVGHFVIQPVVEVSKLSLTRIDTDSGVFCYLLKWKNADTVIKIRINPEEMCAASLEKALSKYGVRLLVSRRKKSDVLMALYSWLLEHAVKITLPRSRGWQLEEGGWIFIGKDDETIEDLEEVTECP